MSSVDLVKLFDDLVPPTGYAAGLVFSSIELPDTGAYRIGKSAAGEPALLIRPADKGQKVAPPIRLQSLSVHHEALCRVSSKGAVLQERTFSVVSCTSSDRELQKYFLDVLVPLIASMGNHPTSDKIVSSVRALVELFRAISNPSRESTQGVWAELLLICLANDPQALASVWHTGPSDRFDFNGGETRIEVKCAAAGRKHHFSLEQLAPPPGTHVAIASFVTTRSAGGLSLREMLLRAQAKLKGNEELQARIYQVVAETLGSGLTAGLTDAYDEQLAISSLRYFWADDLPAPRGAIPPEVTQVRFISDLASCQDVPLPVLQAKQGVFSAL